MSIIMMRSMARSSALRINKLMNAETFEILPCLLLFYFGKLLDYPVKIIFFRSFGISCDVRSTKYIKKKNFS